MNEHTVIINQINHAILNGNFQNALWLCRQHWKSLAANPQFKLAYARSVYHLRLKSPDFSDLNGIVKSVKAVFELAPPPGLLAFYSIRAIIKSPSNLAVIKFILRHHPDVLCPNVLSLLLNTRHPNLNPNENTMKNLTLLYQTSKILHNVGKYDWAHEIASVIINHFPSDIHDPHRIRFWTERIKILSEFQLNPSEQTAKDFKCLIRSEKNWFLFHEMSKIYFQLSQFKSAIHFIIYALADIKNIKKDIPLRFNVLLLLHDSAEKLKATDSSFQTSRLYCLIATLFREAGIVNKLPVHFKNTQCPEYNNHENLIGDFKKEIQNLAAALNIPLPECMAPPLKGIIHSWFPEKGFGFVEYNNQTYYFNKIEHLNNAGSIKKNMTCEFVLKNSFDKKKNKPSLKALLVKLNN